MQPIGEQAETLRTRLLASLCRGVKKWDSCRNRWMKSFRDSTITAFIFAPAISTHRIVKS